MILCLLVILFPYVTYIFGVVLGCLCHELFVYSLQVSKIRFIVYGATTRDVSMYQG